MSPLNIGPLNIGPLKIGSLKNVLFDYGNTLIAFGPDQQRAQAKAMTQILTEVGLQVDEEKLTAVRKDQIMRPYQSGGVENVFEEVCREIVELCGPDISGEITKALMKARQQAFLHAVTVNPEVVSLLDRLSQKYRLGFLSNYPCTQSIVSSLEHLGLKDFFDCIVVSADVGFAKPHPEAFARLIQKMEIEPAESVYVGDNWLADIQGAKRAGMRAILVKEHIPYERFDPQEGDAQPDAELQTLSELEAVLAAWD